MQFDVISFLIVFINPLLIHISIRVIFLFLSHILIAIVDKLPFIRNISIDIIINLFRFILLGVIRVNPFLVFPFLVLRLSFHLFPIITCGIIPFFVNNFINCSSHFLYLIAILIKQILAGIIWISFFVVLNFF